MSIDVGPIIYVQHVRHKCLKQWLQIARRSLYRRLYRLHTSNTDVFPNQSIIYCCPRLVRTRPSVNIRHTDHIKGIIRTFAAKKLKLRRRRRYKTKEMAPMHVLAVIAWLVIMTLAGNEANDQSVKLKTRPSDRAALCALDPPIMNARMYQKVPGAPGALRCGMTCTSDVSCKHFNYVSTESNPCQLYHYRPTNFDILPNCRHYYQPGLKNNF